MTTLSSYELYYLRDMILDKISPLLLLPGFCIVFELKTNNKFKRGNVKAMCVCPNDFTLRQNNQPINKRLLKPNQSYLISQ